MMYQSMTHDGNSRIGKMGPESLNELHFSPNKSKTIVGQH